MQTGDDERTTGETEWVDLAREFGDRLRTRRLAAGLTQEAVALAAGLSKNHIHLLESGRGNPTAPANPRLRTVYDLAAVLGCSVSELLPDA